LRELRKLTLASIDALATSQAQGLPASACLDLAPSMAQLSSSIVTAENSLAKMPWDKFISELPSRQLKDTAIAARNEQASVSVALRRYRMAIEDFTRALHLCARGADSDDGGQRFRSIADSVPIDRGQLLPSTASLAHEAGLARPSSWSPAVARQSR
jgi:hypothetical protein